MPVVSRPVNPHWEQLVRQHMDRTRSLARFYGLRWEQKYHDDIESAAMVGLMQAAQRYNPTEGAAFWTYAKHVITGAMKDAMRNMDNRLSRRDMEVAHSVDLAQHRLAANLGRWPTQQEIAIYLNISVEKLDQLQVWERLVMQAVRMDHEFLEDKSLYDLVADPHPGAQGGVLRKEALEEIQYCVGLLRGRLREVIWLYYWENWSMKEIGRFYGVTESRACQLHGKALDKLRAMLDPQLGQVLN